MAAASPPSRLHSGRHRDVGKRHLTLLRNDGVEAVGSGPIQALVQVAPVPNLGPYPGPLSARSAALLPPARGGAVGKRAPFALVGRKSPQL